MINAGGVRIRGDFGASLRRLGAKKLIMIFLSFFVVNLVIITSLMIITGAHSYQDVFFGADTSRAFGDMTSRNYNHYRAMVHPLFVVFTQPFIFLINLFFANKLLSAVFFQSLIVALNMVLFYVGTKKICLSEKKSLAISVVFYLLFSQIVFSGTFETYVYAQTGLIAMWVYYLYRANSRLSIIDYLFMTFFGVAMIGVTITNFAQYVIFLALAVILNKKESHRVLKFVMIGVTSFCFAVTISQVQNMIWPSAPEFFKGNVLGLLKNDSEELLYIDKNLSIGKINRQIQTSTINNFALASVGSVKTPIVEFSYGWWRGLISLIMTSVLLIPNIIFVAQEKKRILSQHPFYIGILLAFGFNFCLHLIYGSDTPFIYTLHYNFLLVWLVTYSITKIQHKNSALIKIKPHVKKIFWTYVVLQLIGIGLFLNQVLVNFGFSDSIPKKILLVLAVSLASLGILMFKNNKQRLFASIIAFMIVFSGGLYINERIKNGISYQGGVKNIENYELFLKFDDSKRALKSLSEYYKELDVDLATETFHVKRFYNTGRTGTKFFFFGMADRRKIVYQNAKLYDLFTKEIIKEWKIKSDLIVPNEYAVFIIDENDKLIKIYENEVGVFIRNDDGDILLASGNEKINLPSFDGKKYNNILRVLHQEILFNFDNGVLKPNIVTYKDKAGWYRDNMVATMALEKTDNTHLLEGWVKSLTDVYDYQRQSGLPEADNPGELLYILGAVKNDRQDLMEKIKTEVETKAKNGYFSGICDGQEQTYYPTALLITGSIKSNMSLPVNLRLPEEDDAYGRITWWHEDRSLRYDKPFVSRPYPYLEWAQTHYHPYNSPHILDETYPLTYEGDEESASIHTANKQAFYCKFYSDRGISISHVWHAAEMFLTLLEY